MPQYGADRVKETTTKTGNGTDFALAGAVAGFRAFSAAFANVDLVCYCCENGTDWEVGMAYYLTSGNLLSRQFVYSSSAGGTTAVTWGAGTKNIFCTQPGSGGLPRFRESASTTTPTYGLTAGTPGTLSATATGAVDWAQLGRLVTGHLRLTVASFTLGTASGANIFTVSGLPIPESGAVYRWPAVCNGVNLTTSVKGLCVVASWNSGAVRWDLTLSEVTDDGNITAVPIGSFAFNDFIEFSFVYSANVWNQGL